MPMLGTALGQAPGGNFESPLASSSPSMSCELWTVVVEIEVHVLSLASTLENDCMSHKLAIFWTRGQHGACRVAKQRAVERTSTNRLFLNALRFEFALSLK